MKSAARSRSPSARPQPDLGRDLPRSRARARRGAEPRRVPPRADVRHQRVEQEHGARRLADRLRPAARERGRARGARGAARAGERGVVERAGADAARRGVCAERTARGRRAHRPQPSPASRDRDRRARTACGRRHQLPPSSGGFYLYPDFEPVRSHLAEQHVDGGDALATHLLERFEIGVLSGVAFGDEPAALRCRIATSLPVRQDRRRAPRGPRRPEAGRVARGSRGASTASAPRSLIHADAARLAVGFAAVPALGQDLSERPFGIDQHDQPLADRGDLISEARVRGRPGEARSARRARAGFRRPRRRSGRASRPSTSTTRILVERRVSSCRPRRLDRSTTGSVRPRRLINALHHAARDGRGAGCDVADDLAHRGDRQPVLLAVQREHDQLALGLGRRHLPCQPRRRERRNRATQDLELVVGQRQPRRTARTAPDPELFEPRLEVLHELRRHVQPGEREQLGVQLACGREVARLAQLPNLTDCAGSTSTTPEIHPTAPAHRPSSAQSSPPTITSIPGTGSPARRSSARPRRSP